MLLLPPLFGRRIVAGTGVAASEFVPADDATLGFGKLLVEPNNFDGVALVVVSIVRCFRKKSFVLA